MHPLWPQKLYNKFDKTCPISEQRPTRRYHWLTECLRAFERPCTLLTLELTLSLGGPQEPDLTRVGCWWAHGSPYGRCKELKGMKWSWKPFFSFSREKYIDGEGGWGGSLRYSLLVKLILGQFYTVVFIYIRFEFHHDFLFITRTGALWNNQGLTREYHTHLDN